MYKKLWFTAPPLQIRVHIKIFYYPLKNFSLTTSRTKLHAIAKNFLNKEESALPLPTCLSLQPIAQKIIIAFNQCVSYVLKKHVFLHLHNTYPIY